MEVTRWGWLGHEGEVQSKMFSTSDEAIEDMKARSGCDLERTYELGFKLVLLKVKAEPIMVLDKVI